MDKPKHIDFNKLFNQFMDFLQENPDLDITSFHKKYESFLKDEKVKITDFFNKTIELSAFESFDITKILQFLQDWYISLKVINRQIKESKDPYYAETYFLDNIIASLGINFSDLLLPEVKPDFSQNITNLYKIKGSIESIRKALAYFFLIPIEIYELWLEKRSDISQDGLEDLYFIGKCNRINYIKDTNFDLSIIQKYDYLVRNDPHWYYTKEEILNLSNSPEPINLPSLTPYIKVITSPDLMMFYPQYLQMVRNAHIMYNYLKNGADIDQYRLLVHPDLNFSLSLFEIMISFSYLYNKVFNRDLPCDLNGSYLYSNITNKNFNSDDYSTTEIITRKFEYDKLKSTWTVFNIPPKSTDEYNSQHGYILENDLNNHKIHTNYPYKYKLTVQSKIYEPSLFQNEFPNKLIDPNILLFNNTAIISGGITLNNDWNDDIYYANGQEFTNITTNSEFSLPSLFKGSCFIKSDNTYILYGGVNPSGNINTHLFKYSSSSWKAHDFNIKLQSSMAHYVGSEYVVHTLGYDETGNLIKDKVILVDITNLTYKYITTSLLDFNIPDNTYTMDNKIKYDSDLNNNGILVILLHNESKLLKFYLMNNNSFVNEVISVSNINIPSGFDLTNSKVFIDNEDNVFIMNSEKVMMYSNTWQEYIFQNPIQNNYSYLKVKSDIMNNRYFYFFTEENGNITNKIQEIQFIKQKQPYSSVSESSQIYYSSDTYNDGSLSKSVITYDNFPKYSNRRFLIEKLYDFKNLFMDKAPHYLYQDLFVDPENPNIVVKNLGITNKEDSNLLSTIDEIGEYLNLINPDLKQYLDNTLNELDIEKQRRLLVFANMLDLYVRLFWKDIGYFTQLVLNSNDNIKAIINTFKPIITRYTGITTALDFKYDWSNSIHGDEFAFSNIHEYSHEYINTKENFSIGKIIMDVQELPYISPKSYRFDQDNWRNQFFDLQENAVMSIQKVQANITMAIMDKIFVNPDPDLDQNLNESSQFDYITFSEDLEIQINNV